MKHPVISKSIAVCGALLSLAALTQAHPGHSAFDPFAGQPHSGHEAEYLGFFCAALAVVAIAIRAWVKERE